ncbi:sigma-54-dependent transcriptional regulator [candidate division KSB1 bacterium]
MPDKYSLEPSRIKIIVIDDEEIVLKSCERILTRVGYRVETFKQPGKGLKRIIDGHFNIAVVDLIMPDVGGMEVLKAIKEQRPETEVIMITGYSTVQSAVEAMKLGASDYVSKPFNPDELEVVVKKALEKQSLVAENIYLKRELQEKFRLGNLAGRSPRMIEIFNQIRKVAPTSGTILVYGESGTGKEVVARTIHFNSLRKDGPFIVADCSTLAPNLLESELFGHVKGAFTGADRSHRGLFELADGGSLFLDEVSNIHIEAQAKLLRVLDTREIKAVGSEESRKVDIRLIAATNRNLRKMADEEEFRDDLFYRLNVIPINLPPLRDRREDISLLAWKFIQEFAEEHGKEINAIDNDALDQMMDYAWPGNVREMRNSIERLVIMAEGTTITADQVKLAIGRKDKKTAVPLNLDELKEAKKKARGKATAEIERKFILEALGRNHWNVSKTACDIGIQRTNLHALMRKYGIKSKREKGDLLR